ncbi:hypothetical protein CEXT_318601 [Caerostris extrusa]|uniref:Uncharacterized protein n=1 Tax=Caerostris extrusa TaxID=172846 RepID=A0AAV4P957_CAEEX|nr:hypothetical protein CEXT_318601 [Caerostris extrusa]
MLKSVRWNGFVYERNSPEKSSSCSGGTQRPVERKICNRSGPIRMNPFECKKRAFGPALKCRFTADKAVSLPERTVSDMFTVDGKRVKGNKKEK